MRRLTGLILAGLGAFLIGAAVLMRTYLPGHPVYLSNPRARWLQELVYWAGHWVNRGPSIEVIARPRPA